MPSGTRAWPPSPCLSVAPSVCSSSAGAAERVLERASAIGEHAERRGIDGTERSEDERDAQRAAPIRPRTIVQRARRRVEEHADENREQRDDAYEKVPTTRAVPCRACTA